MRVRVSNLFLASLLLYCFSSGAACNVELEVKGSVDPNLNIERIDEGGTIDVFSKRETRYRIVSNVDKDIDVVFTSRNGWILKSDKGNEIPYEVRIYENGDDSIVDKDNPSRTISKDNFVDKKCEFSAKFSAKGSIEEYPAGDYSDKIQISVTAR